MSLLFLLQYIYSYNYLYAKTEAICLLIVNGKLGVIGRAFISLFVVLACSLQFDLQLVVHVYKYIYIYSIA